MVCVERFEVYLMRSAQLKDKSGECLLEVTEEAVQLLDINNPRRVELSWPLAFIRRYSVERGMFSLEAGRLMLLLYSILYIIRLVYGLLIVVVVVVVV